MKLTVATAILCLAALLVSPNVRAAGIREESVLRVVSTCVGTSAPSRQGTAFLVQDWPEQGKVSLVTALHVVHGCKRVELYPSKCDEKRRTARVAKLDAALPTSRPSKLRAWPEHDLVAFLDVTDEPYVKERAKLRWGGHGAVANQESPVEKGSSVAVSGYIQNNVCAGGAGLVTSYATLDQVYNGSAGSLSPRTRLLIYDSTATHGASGGPVTLPGSDVVVGIHEAGFGNSIRVTAATLVTTDQASWGPELEATFPEWSKIAFAFPDDVHFLEQDLAASSVRQKRWFRSSFWSLRAGMMLGGSPGTYGNGGWLEQRRYELGIAYDGEVARFMKDGAHHLRVGAGLMAWPFDEVYLDPAGREFSRRRTWGAGPWVEAAYLLRFRRTQSLRWALGAGLRETLLVHAAPGSTGGADMYSALLAHLQLSGSLATNTAVILLASAGAECGPDLRYQYRPAGGELEPREQSLCFPSRGLFAPVGDLALGVEF